MSTKEALDNMEKILNEKPPLAPINQRKKSHSSWQDFEKILNEFPPKIKTKTAEASVQTDQDDSLPEPDGFLCLAGSSKQESGSSDCPPNSSQLESIDVTNHEEPNDPIEVSARTSEAIPSLARLNHSLEEIQPHATESQVNAAPVLADSSVCSNPDPADILQMRFQENFLDT